jgi:hypothetical protein
MQLAQRLYEGVDLGGPDKEAHSVKGAEDAGAEDLDDHDQSSADDRGDHEKEKERAGS